MSTIHVCGGNTLCGEVDIQGSKNAALPVMAASLLIKGKTVLKNCPMITDVEHMQKLLEAVGCRITKSYQTIEIDASDICATSFPTEHANVMRSSVVLIGALLGRMGEISICYPGGCVIGKRPIDFHLDILGQMGVEFSDKNGCIAAKAGKAENKKVMLPFPSVGATENAILYAAVSGCAYQISGCAREPEIIELCEFLNQAGAKIAGAGTSVITILGVKKLSEIYYRIMPDRIVAGTYLLAGAMTRGLVVLNQAPCDYLSSVFEVLGEMGADLAIAKDWVCLNGENACKPVRYVKTEVYPGFPTDMQSMFMAALSISQGCSILEETIFENRFRVVDELKKMGADIHVIGRRAMVCGVKKLQGAVVEAKELRGGAALLLAGLSADGDTYIKNDVFIRRGYENIVRDLKLLGAKIEEE